MTTELSIIHYGAIALTVTGWIGILAYAGLKGWNGWLALKRAELDIVAGQHAVASAGGPAPLTAATRIDVADLKERVRKLEAIAAGIDL